MLLPEYTITPQTLKNIALIEYSKAIIDTTAILQSWTKQLEDEARVKTIIANGALANQNFDINTVKPYVSQTNLTITPPQEVANISAALETVYAHSKSTIIDESTVKEINKTLCTNLTPQEKAGNYRSSRLPNKTSPDEVLAEIVQLFDWYNSRDAKETHPVILAALLKVLLELTSPFEFANTATANLITQLSLKTTGYDFKNFLSLEDFYTKSKKQYDQLLSSITPQSADFTAWIEYFTEGMSNEAANIKEKVKLLAKDTKVAKVTGRNKVTPRQEKILEYLADYGLMQNKDFKKLLPDVSEDSVLRDLKALLDRQLIKKSGSTKPSVYELA